MHNARGKNDIFVVINSIEMNCDKFNILIRYIKSYLLLHNVMNDF